MTTKEVMDYVLESPYNTNPVILKQMLDNIGGGESGEGVTYETIFEGDAEMVGVAPGMVGCEFIGTAELYNNIKIGSEFYKLSIGDNSCNTGMWINSSNMKYNIYSKNDSLHLSANDGESNKPYAVRFSTQGDASTYHVSLKKIIIPEE